MRLKVELAFIYPAEQFVYMRLKAAHYFQNFNFWNVGTCWFCYKYHENSCAIVCQWCCSLFHFPLGKMSRWRWWFSWPFGWWNLVSLINLLEKMEPWHKELTLKFFAHLKRPPAGYKWRDKKSRISLTSSCVCKGNCQQIALFWGLIKGETSYEITAAVSQLKL